MESLRIPLAQIFVPPDRLRGVDPDQALLIASSFAERGQDTAIQVRPANKSGKHPLIVGGHRLEAARLLGWDMIDAIIRTVSADEARQIEIDENVYRAELSDLDRAIFLAEKKRLYEKAHPEARHGGDRKSDQAAIFGHSIPSFTAEVQDRLGYSERTLRRILQRAKLPPETRVRIAGTALARKGSELDALLKLDPEQQIAALDRVFATDKPARNIADATRIVLGIRPTEKAGSDVELIKLKRAWKDAGTVARSQFLAFLDESGAFSRSGAAQ